MAHIYTHGTGVELDPYQIWTWEDFVGMGDYTGVFYKLMQDLDGQEETHYADGDNFIAWTGEGGFPSIAEFVDNILDGNDKTITNFFLGRASDEVVAPILEMYSVSAETKIHSLNITSSLSWGYGVCSMLVAKAYAPCFFESIVIGSCELAGGNRTAALVGQTEGDPAEVLNAVEITDCHVLDTYAGVAGFGGLVYTGDSCIVYQCSVVAEVELLEPAAGEYAGFVGGIVAMAISNCYISQCFADLDVTDAALEAGLVPIGGICGYAGVSDSEYLPSEIENCYARGTWDRVPIGGGLIGQGIEVAQTEEASSVTSSYAAPEIVSLTDYNGCVGTPFEAGQTVRAYYNATLATPTDDDGSTPLTSVQMRVQGNFVGWNFDSVWGIDSSFNDGWPYLQWQRPTEEGATPDPKLLIRYRNDGKPNWSNYREVSLGKLGDTEIFKRISGLGSYRNRQYEIVCTSGVPLTIAGLEEDVKLGGTSGGN